MKLDTLKRNIAAMPRFAAALMLCALPALAQDEDSEAAPAQQGGHYEAQPTEGEAETETEEAPVQAPAAPAARARAVPRVFRARPGGMRAETNQEAASPAVEEGQSLGGAGQSQGAADNQVGQGSGSSSGRGGGGFSDRPLGGRAAPAGCSISPITWGMGLDMHPGGTPTQRTDIGGMAAYQLEPLQQGLSSPGRVAQTAYGCPLDLSVSANPCEWGTHLVAKGCQSSGVDPGVTGGPRGHKDNYCVLEANKIYYVNVHPLGRGSSAYSDCRYKLAYFIGGENAARLTEAAPDHQLQLQRPPCVPPPAMTQAEILAWFCQQPVNRGPACAARAKTLLPYISPYSKYQNDKWGCPTK